MREPEDFTMPEDPFPVTDGDGSPLPADPAPWHPHDAPVGLPDLAQPAPDDRDWSWYDARVIGIDRGPDVEQRFEVGAIDLYVNSDSGDIGGTYLTVERFDDAEVGAAYLYELQDSSLTGHDVIAQAERAVRERGDQPQWRGASALEYEAYEYQAGLTVGDAVPDLPPDSALEQLLETARSLGATITRRDIPPDDAAKALNTIGLNADTFDPVHNPPPFHDPQSGLSYWIGVYQPDSGSRDHCITSILSLGRNPETGVMEAQLAPCAAGDWDRAYATAEYLIGIAQKGGIEPVFDIAEGMAIATDQRALWTADRGLPLEPDAAQALIKDEHTGWEIER